MVLTFAFIQRRRRERAALERTTSSWIFIAGYLATWTAFGLAAYGLFVGLRAISLDIFSWHRGGPYLAGGILIAAGVYQLTPAKDACLRRCRGPLDFLLTQWREGPSGALRMGIVHGGWCVGCCWALMASLFALGVMSLTWMIVLAGLIAVEKLLPSKLLANWSVTAVLLVGGVAVAFAPSHVPGLTLPGSPAAARAMQHMSMGGGKAMPMGGTSTGGSNSRAGKAMPMGGTSTGGSSSEAGRAMPMGGTSTGGSSSGAGKAMPPSKPSPHPTGMQRPGGATGQPMTMR
jgi:hypothetical protein